MVEIQLTISLDDACKSKSVIAENCRIYSIKETFSTPEEPGVSVLLFFENPYQCPYHIYMCSFRWKKYHPYIRKMCPFSTLNGALLLQIIQILNFIFLKKSHVYLSPTMLDHPQIARSSTNHVYAMIQYKCHVVYSLQSHSYFRTKGCNNTNFKEESIYLG